MVGKGEKERSIEVKSNCLEYDYIRYGALGKLSSEQFSDMYVKYFLIRVQSVKSISTEGGESALQEATGSV